MAGTQDAGTGHCAAAMATTATACGAMSSFADGLFTLEEAQLRAGMLCAS